MRDAAGAPGRQQAVVDSADARRDVLPAVISSEFDAPSRVALYLFEEHVVVIENFNDEPIDATLTMQTSVRPKVALTIPAGNVALSAGPGSAKIKLPPRSLVALRFGR